MDKDNPGLPTEIVLQIVEYHQEQDAQVYDGFYNLLRGKMRDEPTIKRSSHIYRQLCRATRKPALAHMWKQVGIFDMDDLDKLLRWVHMTPNADEYLGLVQRLDWTPIEDLFESMVDPTMFLDEEPELEWYEVVKPALFKLFKGLKNLETIRWEFNTFTPLPLDIAEVLQSHNSVRTININWIMGGRDFVYSVLPLGWTTLEVELMNISDFPNSFEEEEAWMNQQLEKSKRSVRFDQEKPLGINVTGDYAKLGPDHSFFCGVIDCRHYRNMYIHSWITSSILKNLQFILQKDAKPIQREADDKQKVQHVWKPLVKVAFDFPEVMYLTSTLPIFLFGVEIASTEIEGETIISSCIQAIQEVRQKLLRILAFHDPEDKFTTLDKQIAEMCREALLEKPNTVSTNEIVEAPKHRYLKGRLEGVWPNFDQTLDCENHVKQILLMLVAKQELREAVVKIFTTLKDFCLDVEDVE